MQDKRDTASKKAAQQDISVGITDEEWITMEKSGKISSELRRMHPTLHFCPEWDYMLIDKFMPAYDACVCEEFTSDGD